MTVNDTLGAASNAYIFTPDVNNSESLPYFNSTPKVVDFSNEFMQETVFYFDGNLASSKRGARLIVRAFEKSPLLEVESHLYPVPIDNSS